MSLLNLSAIRYRRIAVRRLRAKPDKIIVDVSCDQAQFLEDSSHGRANRVVMRIDRCGILSTA